MIPKKHHLEAVVLKRRLELLSLCDELILHNISEEDYYSSHIQKIFSQFSDVREIEDLIASLEEIHNIKRSRNKRREH